MSDLLITNATIWTLGEAGTLEKGWLAVKDGVIEDMGPGEPPAELKNRHTIDAGGRHLLPGLADCHTHLMEYATAEVHHTLGRAQEMAAVSNLLTALSCGIIATGEHHLGHPALTMPMETYQRLLRQTPMRSAIAFGCCWLGFSPKVLTSCTRPGQAFTQDVLTDDEYRQMAAASEFAGENLFLNYTCANAPLSAAPHAGEITYTREKLKHIVEIFHAEGKAIGAHIEGDCSALLFMECGGDVIHHGHAISPAVGQVMAEKHIPLVVTPLAGTSKRPTSPAESYGFYRQGVFLALASDSYIPPHPDADWIPVEKGQLAGPREFLAACGSTLRYFVEQGVSREEALKLITVNGRSILRPNEPPATLTPGRPADMLLCDRLPALETENPEDIRMVIVAGEILIDRLS